MKQKKQLKKKTFGRFFRRKLCICLLTAAALAGGFFYYSWKKCTHLYPESFIQSMQEYEDPDDTETKMERRLRKTDTGENSVLMRTIPEALALASVNGFYSADSERALILYQPETGEIYTSEPYAAVTVLQNEEKKHYFLHDQALIDRLALSPNFYEGAFNYAGYVYSIYVKDDQFVPGEVYVCKDTIFPLPRYQKEGMKIPGEWVDMSPADTNGWTKICNDRSREYLEKFHDYIDDPAEYDPYERAKKLSRENGSPHIGSIYIFGTDNSPRAAALMQRMQEELPARHQLLAEAETERIHNAIYGDNELIQSYLEEWEAETPEEVVIKLKKHYRDLRRNLPMRIYNQSVPQTILFDGITSTEAGSTLQFKDRTDAPRNYEADVDDVQFRGEKWILFHFQYINPYLCFRSAILRYVPLCIAPILILTVLAALLWSVIAYLLYSRKYDIEAYRKNLTGTLAHDLKTPLAVIYGHAENIRAHAHPENTDEYADCIMENVTHIDEMIAGVLGLAQLESRAAPDMKEQVDLTALLHTAFQRNAAGMEARGLTLTKSGTFVIRGNADMLTQLAENLAANAVQHAAEGTEITVTAEARTLRIRNAYTGELDEKTLCEPFKRGDSARGSQSGSGLGLSIVQQIAALHKLRLRVTARDGVFTASLKSNRRNAWK